MIQYFSLLSFFLVSANLLGANEYFDDNELLQAALLLSLQDQQGSGQFDPAVPNLSALLLEYSLALEQDQEAIFNEFSTALSQGANPNLLLEDEHLLIGSINFGFFPIAYLLASSPSIDANIKDKALTLSLKAKNLDLAKELLLHGANPNSSEDFELLTEAIRDKPEILSALVDRKDEHALYVRQEILRGAIGKNNLELVTLLVNGNVDAHEVGKYGTALDLAVRRGHDDCVRIILKAPPTNSNFRENDESKHYLQRAFEQCPSSSVVILLLENKMVTASKEDLIRALRRETINVQEVKLLLKMNLRVAPNDIDEDLATIISYNSDIRRLLADFNVRINFSPLSEFGVSLVAPGYDPNSTSCPTNSSAPSRTIHSIAPNVETGAPPSIGGSFSVQMPVISSARKDNSYSFPGIKLNQDSLLDFYCDPIFSSDEEEYSE